MNIPHHLLTEIRQGRVILLLGAGASIGSADPRGTPAPDGKKLARLLDQEFLGGKFGEQDLQYISELAMTAAGRLKVQDYIKNLLEELKPHESHQKLTKFRWAGLATTNYDMLIEKAYTDAGSSAIQRIIPFIHNGDQVVSVQRDPNSILLLKLHGCISRSSSQDTSFVLTMDDYISSHSGRDRIYSTLTEWAYENTIIFIGNAGRDPNIREAIFHLNRAIKDRGSYFMVTPDMQKEEEAVWQQKRTSLLKGTFSEFMNLLDVEIPSFSRIIATPVQSFPLASRIRVPSAIFSETTLLFLNNDAQVVSSTLRSKDVSALSFYGGFGNEWSPILKKFDVRRSIVDEILEDIFLLNDYQARKPLEIVLIKGYAGSGKTVALRRIAWDAANILDCLCIYIEDSKRTDIASIREIVTLCKERVFLFIDNAPDRIGEIRSIINDLGLDGELLTLVLAARTNEWNQVPGFIKAQVRSEYEVEELKKKEVMELIVLLEKHNALGQLTNRTHEERVDVFEELAGRQLLVALHEATMGRPFEDIVVGEYRNLFPDEAQRIYLTVCIFNRLKVPVRAGVIARIHGVPFSEFKSRLFGPLEHVVYDKRDDSVRDYVYVARHPYIADIVFERLLTDPDERFAEYQRCVENLNLDYLTDEKAFKSLIKGRSIADLFPCNDHANAIFDIAVELAGNEAHLLQQRAIYEMARQNGNLNKAESFIDLAIQQQPSNRFFKHTKSEISLRRAENATSILEINKHLKSATNLAIEARNERFGETYSFHTLAKVGIKRLKTLFDGGEDATSPEAKSIINDIEVNLAKGFHVNPTDTYLLSAQAEFAKLLKDTPKVIESLEKAFKADPAASFLAIQLAAYYQDAGDNVKSDQIYQQALKGSSSNKVLHFRYGLFLMNSEIDLSKSAYHLRKSLAQGNQSFKASLLYARVLFLNRDYPEAEEEFKKLRESRTAPYIEGGCFPSKKRYRGAVVKLSNGYICAKEVDSNFIVYIPNSMVREAPGKKLQFQSQVEFSISFNYKGLVGFDCILCY